MLTGKDAFARWAPPESPWSAWAKPTLFVSMEDVKLDPQQNLAEAFEEVQLPGASEGWALLLELEGALSIRLGLRAAAEGYRPIPLFNGWPDKINMETLPTQPLIHELLRGVRVLESLELTGEAPPAFLLDRDRLEGRAAPIPGDFDNRWMVFPQDLPSARCLKERGIHRVLWITRKHAEPGRDLAHILFQWQSEGIAIHARTLPGEEVALLEVSRPSRFQSLWQRALAMLKLRRNSAGGFGSIIPDPLSGSGLG